MRRSGQRMGLELSFLFVTSVTMAAQEPVDRAKEELEKQQGTWEVVCFEREGKKTPEEITRTIVRVVEGDHVVWKRDGKSFAGTTIVLDPTVEPKAIDLIPDGGKNRGERVRGIYRFEPDGTLTICVADAGKERPTGFVSAAESGWTLQVFRKREKEPRSEEGSGRGREPVRSRRRD